MSRFRHATIVLLVAVVVATLLVWANRGRILSSLFAPMVASYPRPLVMPAVVPASVDQLLAKYEGMLKAGSPETFATLQPGLTDAEIDAIEAEHGFKLTPDLRSLYRWRNGTPHRVTGDAFPDYHFIPLDEAVARREEFRRQFNEQTGARRLVDTALIGHLINWLDVFVALDGVGYFFDPTRSEAEGSFFYAFEENFSYTFFPAFRNYLAAVVEGCENGAFGFAGDGAQTNDFAKARQTMLKYGSENVR